MFRYALGVQRHLHFLGLLLCHSRHIWEWRQKWTYFPKSFYYTQGIDLMTSFRAIRNSFMNNGCFEAYLSFNSLIEWLMSGKSFHLPFLVNILLRGFVWFFFISSTVWCAFSISTGQSLLMIGMRILMFMISCPININQLRCEWDKFIYDLIHYSSAPIHKACRTRRTVGKIHHAARSRLSLRRSASMGLLSHDFIVCRAG